MNMTKMAEDMSLFLQTGAEKQEFYTDSDLMIGSILNVYGKKFILCDCDDFTKEYYVTKYGISKCSAH